MLIKGVPCLHWGDPGCAGPIQLQIFLTSLWWHHNGCDSVSNHQPDDCLFNRSLRHRSKKTSKLRVTGLCAWNSPGTGEFPAQMASNSENVSIWWRHHVQKGEDTKFHNCMQTFYCIHTQPVVKWAYYKFNSPPSSHASLWVIQGPLSGQPTSFTHRLWTLPGPVQPAGSQSKTSCLLAKTVARQYENLLSVEIWCTLY